MIIDYILLVFGLVILVPVMVLLIQVVFAVLSKVEFTPKRNSNLISPTIAVIVPAHNEEQGIAETLKGLVPQLENNRLIVVADNCTDNTAKVAKSMGAITLERFDEKQRGKGYALDYALKYLAKAPPEVVIIVDADCIVDNKLVESLANECISQNRPVQANNIMTYPEKGGVKQQVAELAWLVKNTVRPLGLSSLGLPCQLTGTGMALRWEHIMSCNLASGNLVEDMQLGLDMARIKAAPIFMINTHVRSFFPTSKEGQSTQRARWEHGHLSIIFGQLPSLIKEAVLKGNKLLLVQLLDISVPPLALLLIAILILLSLSTVNWMITGRYFSLVIYVFLIAIFGLSILIAWAKFGRHIISFKSLILAPFILLGKLPVYLSFIFNRQVEWVRSKRD